MPKTRSTTMEPVESEETLGRKKSPARYKCNKINVQNGYFSGKTDAKYEDGEFMWRQVNEMINALH
ncbi:hypothetical protein T10_3245 [Trichinella papuae]|uniref:Uncharacterized protein n=1 Tax=Trichinella papuae TaxID=268474 RepID=A0A0V1N9V0_9BILA|nr:hypothetical protein T10_3245 [Trichinella papuae]